MIPAMGREAGVGARSARASFVSSTSRYFRPEPVLKRTTVSSAREEFAGQQFLVSDQRRRAFGRGEDAFHLRPVANRVENLGVGDGEGEASTFFQDVEDQVVAVRLRHAQT